MISHWALASGQNMLKWWLNISSPTRPTQFWLALSPNSADPNSGTWTESTVANYARQQITWAYGGDIYASNSNQLVFANLGSGQITGQAIYDASSGGNLIAWADLDSTIVFATGHTFNYNAGLIRLGVTL